MSLYGLGLFIAVYALAVATPGPGIAAILARSMSRGLHGAPAFIAGFVMGDFIWFTLAVTGLAAIAKTAATLFLLIKYAGAAYLLYLAYKLWTSTPAPVEASTAPAAESNGRAFLSSLALTLGNPKAIIFFWRCCQPWSICNRCTRSDIWKSPRSLPSYCRRFYARMRLPAHVRANSSKAGVRSRS